MTIMGDGEPFQKWGLMKGKWLFRHFRDYRDLIPVPLPLLHGHHAVNGLSP
jgi:hypothetical protein